jgi:hypothetical protein
MEMEGFALTLEETDESTATRREEVAPVILSTCSWVSVKPEVSKINTSVYHKNLQRCKLGQGARDGHIPHSA